MKRRLAVVVSPLAELDLEAVHAYLEGESRTLADLVYLRISAAIRSLERFPRRHRLARVRGFRRSQVRVFTVASHRVYYKVYPDRVVVLRVWHTARRPPPAPLE